MRVKVVEYAIPDPYSINDVLHTVYFPLYTLHYRLRSVASFPVAVQSVGDFPRCPPPACPACPPPPLTALQSGPVPRSLQPWPGNP